MRFSGDTRKHSKAQLFAWEAYEKGVDVHLLAEPTKLELLQKDYEKKKDEFKHRVQQNVLQRCVNNRLDFNKFYNLKYSKFSLLVVV